MVHSFRAVPVCGIWGETNLHSRLRLLCRTGGKFDYCLDRDFRYQALHRRSLEIDWLAEAVVAFAAAKDARGRWLIQRGIAHVVASHTMTH